MVNLLGSPAGWRWWWTALLVIALRRCLVVRLAAAEQRLLARLNGTAPVLGPSRWGHTVGTASVLGLRTGLWCGTTWENIELFRYSLINKA